jgi:hypothetical protein
LSSGVSEARLIVAYADDRATLEGLAGLACFFAEQGWDEADARWRILEQAGRTGALNERDLRRAAAAVDALPRPIADDIAGMPRLPLDESGYDLEPPSSVEVREARDRGRQLLLALAAEVEAGENK